MTFTTPGSIGYLPPASINGVSTTCADPDGVAFWLCIRFDYLALRPTVPPSLPMGSWYFDAVSGTYVHNDPKVLCKANPPAVVTILP